LNLDLTEKDSDSDSDDLTRLEQLQKDSVEYCIFVANYITSNGSGTIICKKTFPPAGNRQY